MKINWFSPLPPDKTDIGNFSRKVLSTLREQYEVVAYTDTDEAEPIKGVPIEPLSTGASFWKKIHAGDYNFYQIGNDIRFHSQIMEASRICSGILVLHDLHLHESVRGQIIKYQGGKAEYLSTLIELYGEKAFKEAKLILDGEGDNSDELSAKYPMFEWLLRKPSGIITHNPNNLEKLKEKCSCPILYTPLPYLSRNEFSQGSKQEPNKDQLRLIVFGFLNGTNRRIDSILEAIASCPQKAQIRLDIVGVYKQKEMEKKVAKHDLKQQVKLHGFTESDRLDQLIYEADLALNLRYPSFGEASGSLLRIWNQGTACLVTKTGYYATLPKGTVEWVDPQREVEDLHKHFDLAMNQPEYFRDIANAGRAHLQQEHAIETYIDRIIDFLPEVSKYRQSIAAIHTAERITKWHLADYPLPEARTQLLNRVSKEINQWI